MDIITLSVSIIGTLAPAQAIISALCAEDPTEDQKWTAIRQIRSELISQSDWTQLPDAALTPAEQTAWQDYRQALRDLPQDFDLPEDVTFPVSPS